MTPPRDNVKTQVFIQPVLFPENLMLVSAGAPGLSFHPAAWALLGYFVGSYTPASWFPNIWYSALRCGAVGKDRPGLKLLAHLKVFSSPKTVGGKAAVGCQPGFPQLLRQELAQQLCGH